MRRMRQQVRMHRRAPCLAPFADGPTNPSVAASLSVIDRLRGTIHRRMRGGRAHQSGGRPARTQLDQHHRGHLRARVGCNHTSGDRRADQQSGALTSRKTDVMTSDNESGLVHNLDECSHSIQRELRRHHNQVARIHWMRSANHWELSPILLGWWGRTDR